MFGSSRRDSFVNAKTIEEISTYRVRFGVPHSKASSQEDILPSSLKASFSACRASPKVSKNDLIN